MQPDSIDWRLLRNSALVLVIALGISGALVYGGLDAAEHARLIHKGEKNRFQAARARYLTLDDEARIIQEFAPRFAEFVDAGLIGEERRLSWVETLRTVARGLKVPALRYEISSQEKVTPEYPIPPGSFGVYGTQMRLRMGLLHGADLPAVFLALSEAAKGLFTVSGCSITRPYAESMRDINPSEPNLTVDCRLTWLVTKRPERPS